MVFLIIPAIDIKDGKCVQLQQGDINRVIFSSEDPVKIAIKWEEAGASYLHIVSLDNTFAGHLKDIETLKEIVESITIPVEYGGGIRSLEDIETLVGLGIDKVILGTVLTKLSQPEIFLEEVTSRVGKNKIVASLDSKNFKILANGWKHLTKLDIFSFAEKIKRYVWGFLYTDVNVEGLMRGINKVNVKKVLENIKSNVIISGGISKTDDILFCKKNGAVGVIIGSALYTGKLKFEDVKKYEEC